MTMFESRQLAQPGVTGRKILTLPRFSVPLLLKRPVPSRRFAERPHHFARQIGFLHLPICQAWRSTLGNRPQADCTTDALLLMQHQQARRIGAPPVEEFFVSDGSRTVSRVTDSPEFFELIRRGDGTESELMSCVGFHWALSERIVRTSFGAHGFDCPDYVA